MRGISRVVLVTVGLTIGLVPAMAGAQGAQRNILGIEKAPITGPIATDRPSFSDNPALVPRGHFVLEAGYRYDDNQTGGQTHTVPNLLLRSGVTDTIELRLGFDGYKYNSPGSDGAGNTSVGAKIHLLDETRASPTVAVIPQVSLASGDDDVAADKTEPEVRLTWGKGLTDSVGIGGNLNIAERVDARGNRNLETAVSLAGGFSLTERLGGYVEYYSVFPEVRGGDDSAVINAGFAYLTNNATQLDAFIGTGLNATASQPFLGLGIAHLW